MANLDQVSGGRSNHFNLLRMLAATAVLVSHSYVLCTGNPLDEPLYRVLWTFNLGRLAVLLFFAISGFLITKSFDTRSSVVEFATARVLRIFPGLVVTLTFCAFVVGPVCTTLPLSQYFHGHVWGYFFGGLSLVWFKFTLPGVFTHNPFPAPVNASLWTLYYEALCYVGVVVLGSIGALRPSRFVWFLLAYGSVYTAVRIHFGHPGVVVSYTDLTLAFVVGMALYVYRRHVFVNGIIFAVVIALLVLLRHTPLRREGIILVVAYGAFWAAYLNVPLLLRYNKLGDYSYGTYIFAFPLQQMLANFWHGIAPWQMFAVAFPATLVLATLSWYFIEGPALRRRHAIGKALNLWVESRMKAA